MPRCADGSNDCISCHMNLSYHVNFILRHAMATATTKWLRQQHLLAARFSSFTSCRSKATTNGDEMSMRYIASRDGDDNLSCQVAPMAAMTTFCVTQWRQRPHRVQVHSIAQWRRLIILYRTVMMMTICALRDGNDNKTTAATTTLLPAQ